SGDPAVVDRLRALYRERRDVLVGGLRTIGIACDPPGGTFYVWVPVPRGLTAAGLARRCLEEAHVVVTPGNGFGDAGEGYIRLTLCSPSERLREAVERLKRLKGIEKAMGRKPVKGKRWGSRVIDLDILLCDQQVVETRSLKVPHPEMHKRRFVLLPLAELAPHVVHPHLGQSVSSLLAGVKD